MKNIKNKWQRQILNSDLPATTRHIMLTLSIYMNPDGSRCFPSVGELTSVTGLSPNCIRDHLRLAIKKKILRAEKAGFRGAKTEQRQFFPLLKDAGVQEMHPFIDRGSGAEALPPERGSNNEQKASSGEQRASGDEPNHIITNTLPKKRATKIPAPSNFKISDNLKIWCQEKGFNGDLQETIEACFDWHRAKGNKYQDWEATVRNWIRKDLELAGTKAKPTRPKGVVV